MSPYSSTDLFPYFKAHPVSFLNVTMTDGFWAPRQQVTREVTLDWVSAAHDAAGGLKKLREHPEDYEAKTICGEMEHIKFMEAMATAAGVEYDEDIIRLVDAWAKPLIESQAADGYLAEGFPFGFSRPFQRWEVRRGWESHEDYAIGHYIEAAVAHYEVTGRTELLDSAAAAAANMAKSLLGTDNQYAPGHPEIEQALVRLYRATGEEEYLRLCGWLLEQRGHHTRRPSYGRRGQDHMPIRSQRSIEGHAVCAANLFNGATEYMGATGDDSYREAILSVWNDLITSKMYLHGASGNLSATNEGYLPTRYQIRPDDCYGETCAAVSNFRWAHSLFALTGEADYVDAAERMLYNAIPASLSLAGDSSFYTNVAQTGLPAAAGNPEVARGAVTLASGARRDAMRFSELAASCCPPYIVKLINSVGGYLYSIDDAGIFVKHYGESDAEIPYEKGVRISQRTDYPWSGAIFLTVHPAAVSRFTLRLRIPAWAADFSLTVNGSNWDVEPAAGWVGVEREWQPNDQVELDLPMDVERVRMAPEFAGYENRAALRRGPVVYCLEEQDLDLSAEDERSLPGGWMIEAPALHQLYIPEGGEFVPEYRPNLLGGVTVLRGKLSRLTFEESDQKVSATFIPYCVWGNRDPSEMRIWLGARATPIMLFLGQQAGADVGLEDFD